MVAFMFPGQGSQKKGMGHSFFSQFPKWTQDAEQILGYSLEELCLSDPRNELGQTQFTQPALYVVNAMAYEVWVRRTGTRPSALLGHSLGEYNALLAAGVFDFAAGLRLVQRRGELMAQCRGGAMAAVMRCSADELRDLLEREGLNTVDLANFNAPSQIVISGLREDIARAKAVLEAHRKGVIVLNTGGAFHSRHMRSIVSKFREAFAEQSFSAPEIPVIANYDALPYRFENTESNLAKQIASPVRWTRSVQYLLDAGETEFEETEGSRVLTNLVRRVVKAHKPKPQAGASVGKTAAPRPDVDVESKVERWNRSHPVGTRIRSEVVNDAPLVTKTPAMVLFGCRAAIYVEGYNGYFDLDEVSVTPGGA